jgi:hypothetical protein
MSKRSWKDHLLSSGLPLEYSVTQIYERLGIWRPAEFHYERDDENGISRIFSVDVSATDLDINTNLWVEHLVECKYRHDGTQWIFTPREYEPYWLGPNFADLFVGLDAFCSDRKFNYEALSKFNDNYFLCGKGIELMPDDANPKTIEQAIQQLRYAVVAKAVASIDSRFNPPSEEKLAPLVVIVPIIVTTAELWRLKPGMTVEQVRSANELRDVAENHELLVILQEPTEVDSRHARSAFARRFRSDGYALLDAAIKNVKPRSGFQNFINTFAARKPSLFIVISYSRIESALANLHRFFTHKSIITPRVKRSPTT